MKELSDAVVRELRCTASQGASVPELLRLLVDRLGPEAAYSTALARYFMAAFELPLRTVSPIGGWSGAGGGEVSDARIQELIYPEMIERRARWVVRDNGQE